VRNSVLEGARRRAPVAARAHAPAHKHDCRQPGGQRRLLHTTINLDCMDLAGACHLMRKQAQAEAHTSSDGRCLRHTSGSGGEGGGGSAYQCDLALTSFFFTPRSPVCPHKHQLFDPLLTSFLTQRSCSSADMVWGTGCSSLASSCMACEERGGHLMIKVGITSRQLKSGELGIPREGPFSCAPPA